MHPLFPRASQLTETIIGGAIEVHRDKGAGLVDLRMVFDARARASKAAINEPETRSYRLQGLLQRRASPLRLARRGLRPDRSQGRRSHSPHPQGSTLELYETIKRAARPSHQFQRHQNSSTASRASSSPTPTANNSAPSAPSCKIRIASSYPLRRPAFFGAAFFFRGAYAAGALPGFR